MLALTGKPLKGLQSFAPKFYGKVKRCIIVEYTSKVLFEIYGFIKILRYFINNNIIIIILVIFFLGERFHIC